MGGLCIGKVKDMTGMKFGRLKVINRSGTYISPSGTKESIWLCICNCGNHITARGSSLRNGNTKSCGCLSKELARNRLLKHGHADKERLYRTWLNMRNRCNNANCSKYHLYGGRGIVVCDEWNDYEYFRKWALSNGYSDSLTLDRKDTNADYSPSNCRWVNQQQQCNNKNNNHYLTYLGKTQSIADWARELGIKYSTLRSRINSCKWTVKKALTHQ